MILNLCNLAIVTEVVPKRIVRRSNNPKTSCFSVLVAAPKKHTRVVTRQAQYAPRNRARIEYVAPDVKQKDKKKGRGQPPTTSSDRSEQRGEIHSCMGHSGEKPDR